MAPYFRITAYHKEGDTSIIADSYGQFEKLWQFSAYLVSYGFTILEVGSDGTFTDGNMERIGLSPDSPALRACGKGEPKRNGNRVEVSGMYYEIKMNE